MLRQIRILTKAQLCNFLNINVARFSKDRKKKNGMITIKGKEFALLQPGAAYPAYYLTAVISAVILLAPLALGAAVAYYAIWVMAAWLFILAVYFTSKLM